jgi:predicted GIY-YIG superfamily endonuclease
MNEIIEFNKNIEYNNIDDNYIVYLLLNTSNNCTYVGITNNPEKRLKKHNQIIKGGAKYTKLNKKDGTWYYYGFILGLDKSTALSIEKKIHIYSKKTYGKNPLEKRLNCINNIIQNYKYLSFTIV